MKSRQKKIHLAPIDATKNSGRSIFRTSKSDLKNVDIRKLGKRLRKRDGVAKVLIGIRGDFNALSHAHHHHVRESLIAIYGAAQLLVADRSSWVEFCRHRELRELKRAPRVRHPEDALRVSVKLAVGGTGKHATRKSSRFHKLLEPFFDRGIPLLEVAAVVRDRGLKGLSEVGANLNTGKNIVSKSTRLPACRFTLEDRNMAKTISSAASGTKFKLFGKVKKSKSGAIEMVLYKLKTR